ncbi:MAG TPA: hypothetical protein DEQ20_07625 [Desulfobulbaceae bacterium]|nr:MAG: hypothetical protein A2520_03925 [Deltaproteobacteria bacterium RIFOXYD12_FULL_53_23]HCC54776.1 hypothetical protein [Desulfobulbaceae bacterium]
MLQRINLVPGFSATDHLRRLMPLLLTVTLLLIAAVLAGEHWWLQKRNALLVKEITILETAAGQSEELQGSIQQLNAQAETLRSEVTMTADQADRLAGHFFMKPDFADILTEIGQVMPSSMRIDKITINRDGGNIEGQALHYQDLPQLADKLRRNSRFTSVLTKEIDRSGEAADSPFRFIITFQLQSDKRPTMRLQTKS